CPAVLDQFLVPNFFESGERQQPRMETCFTGESGLGHSLPGLSTDAGNPHRLGSGGFIARIHCLDGKLQNRFKERMLWFANFKLSGVDANRDPASAGSMIIPRERALLPFVKLALPRQSQRMRGNDQSFAKLVQNP